MIPDYKLPPRWPVRTPQFLDEPADVAVEATVEGEVYVASAKGAASIPLADVRCGRERVPGAPSGSFFP
jgi:hypothetical protein